MPLRNAHDIVNLNGKKILASMAPSAKPSSETAVEDAPVCYTYAKLFQHSSKVSDPHCPMRRSWVDPNWGGDEDYETDEDIPVCKSDTNTWSTGRPFCKFCKKLGIPEGFPNEQCLGVHMKNT